MFLTQKIDKGVIDCEVTCMLISLVIYSSKYVVHNQQYIILHVS